MPPAEPKPILTLRARISLAACAAAFAVSGNPPEGKEAFEETWPKFAPDFKKPFEEEVKEAVKQEFEEEALDALEGIPEVAPDRSNAVAVRKAYEKLQKDYPGTEAATTAYDKAAKLA